MEPELSGPGFISSFSSNKNLVPHDHYNYFQFIYSVHLVFTALLSSCKNDIEKSQSQI